MSKRESKSKCRKYMLDRMAAFMLDRLPEYMTIARTIVRINMSKRMPDLKICQIACKIEFQKFNLEDMSDRRPDWMSECNVGRIPDRLQIESWCQIECQYLRKKELVGITQIILFSKGWTELWKLIFEIKSWCFCEGSRSTSWRKTSKWSKTKRSELCEAFGFSCSND